MNTTRSTTTTSAITILLLAVLCSSEAAARTGAARRTGRITGIVRNVAGIPMKQADVALAGTSHEVIADTAGRFTFRSLRPGTYTIVTGYVGHRRDTTTVSVKARRTTTVEIKLYEQALPLDTVIIIAPQPVRHNNVDKQHGMPRGEIRNTPRTSIQGVVVKGAPMNTPTPNGFVIRGRRDQGIPVQGMEVNDPFVGSFISTYPAVSTATISRVQVVRWSLAIEHRDVARAGKPVIMYPTSVVPIAVSEEVIRPSGFSAEFREIRTGPVKFPDIDEEPPFITGPAAARW